MNLNLSTLKNECVIRGWRFELDGSGGGVEFMIQSAHASVSVVGNLSGESRMYANGETNEVVSMAIAIKACMG